MRFSDLLLLLKGATSGEQILKTAAATSGAITLPAGTVDFSATGGAGQVVKQVTAGAPFTVAQVAASEVTGLVGLSADALIKGGGAGAAPVASTATVDSSGNLSTIGSATLANGVGTGDASIELGSGRTGSGAAYLDLHAASGTDYEARFERQSGANGSANLINTGTGAFSIYNTSGYVTLGRAASGSDPVKILVAAGSYARALYEVTGGRRWSAGITPTGMWYIADETAGQGRLQIDTAGACTNTTGTWSAISDVRLKKDIEPYERGLAAILRLDPVTFKFNGLRLPDDGVTHYGLIADDVAAIVPEIVGETDVGAGPDSEKMMVKTVDPGRLTYALINAIKELTARVAALEAALSARDAPTG